jgi:hypothetical protein
MRVEVSKYVNEEEIMTVVKLIEKESGTVVSQLKIYNDASEIEIDRDLRETAERIDDFLVRLISAAERGHVEIESTRVSIS